MNLPGFLVKFLDEHGWRFKFEDDLITMTRTFSIEGMGMLTEMKVRHELIESIKNGIDSLLLPIFNNLFNDILRFNIEHLREELDIFVEEDMFVFIHSIREEMADDGVLSNGIPHYSTFSGFRRDLFKEYSEFLDSECGVKPDFVGQEEIFVFSREFGRVPNQLIFMPWPVIESWIAEKRADKSISRNVASVWGREGAASVEASKPGSIKRYLEIDREKGPLF